MRCWKYGKWMNRLPSGFVKTYLKGFCAKLADLDHANHVTGIEPPRQSLPEIPAEKLIINLSASL